MPSTAPVERRAPSPWWEAFKLVVLVVGGAIAFMPDHVRPHVWRLLGLLLTNESVVSVLIALGAVLAVFVGLSRLGGWLLPEEAGIPEGPDQG